MCAEGFIHSVTIQSNVPLLQWKLYSLQLNERCWVTR